MSRVSLTINGRQFRIACEDGREGYLMNLAREIDNRINGLRSKSGEISDTGLMVMMAITLADELAEAGQRIKRLEGLNQMLASSRRSAEQDNPANLKRCWRQPEGCSSTSRLRSDEQGKRRRAIRFSLSLDN